MTAAPTTASAGRFTPTKADNFTFGLWTVGWRAADPFGSETRPHLDAVEAVERLAELGAMGITFHDDDLFPFGCDETTRDTAVSRLKKACESTGLRVPMVTTNLFSHPVFRDGGLTSNDRVVRRFALRKLLRNIDLAAELGADTFVMWGGREGAETGGAKDVRAALDRMREGVDTIAGYIKESGYGLRVAIEPKPNEPRADILLPTVGHALAFVEQLEHSDIVGVNPEVGHEEMSNLNFPHAIAQALWAGKLFHIDLNGQKPGRYDQDFRFGQEDQKTNFFLVKLLEDVGYAGPKHFDAHALRTSNLGDVWEFAKGCMRTYLILKEKAARFNADAEIQGILKELHQGGASIAAAGFDKSRAQALKSSEMDADELAKRPLPYEKLDQLTVELLLGVR